MRRCVSIRWLVIRVRNHLSHAPEGVNGRHLGVCVVENSPIARGRTSALGAGVEIKTDSMSTLECLVGGESGCMSFSSSSSVNQQRSCGWHQWSTSHRVEGWVQVATVGPLSFAICRSLCFEVVEILDVYVCMHCARQP